MGGLEGKRPIGLARVRRNPLTHAVPKQGGGATRRKGGGRKPVVVFSFGLKEGEGGRIPYPVAERNINGFTTGLWGTNLSREKKKKGRRDNVWPKFKGKERGF